MPMCWLCIRREREFAEEQARETPGGGARPEHEPLPDAAPVALAGRVVAVVASVEPAGGKAPSIPSMLAAQSRTLCRLREQGGRQGSHTK
jgi:hypothetical protein